MSDDDITACLAATVVAADPDSDIDARVGCVHIAESGDHVLTTRKDY